VRSLIPGFDALSDNRKIALSNMAYNLGLPRMKGFQKMLAAISRGDFKAASTEMLDSKWAQQVGDRAKRLAVMVDNG
jgi:lysozyme